MTVKQATDRHLTNILFILFLIRYFFRKILFCLKIINFVAFYEVLDYLQSKIESQANPSKR
jgi:hypothetical protein